MNHTDRSQETAETPEAAHGRSDSQHELVEILRQREAISQVMRAIASSPHDLQPIFQAILDNAAHLCRLELGSFRLFEKAGLRLVAYKSSPAVQEIYSPPKLRKHDDFMGRIAANKSVVHIPDLAAHEVYRAGDPELTTLVNCAGIRTGLYVPLLRNDELIGLLSISRVGVDPFTDREIQLVTDFAAEAAIALEIIRRERQFREAQMELEHANRIATMGQLSSSIAHEVNQPITAVISNSQAARNWLRVGSANLAEARTAIDRVIEEAYRVANIIGRIRDLIKKAPPKRDRFDINEAIIDMIILTRGEAVKNGVSVQTQLADGLPLVEADRVQLQQVILNLIINAIQAMRDVDARRNLHLSTVNLASEGTLVTVRDSGSGLKEDHLERLFEPFYTTKPDGLGMGLPICQSIIEAHGGRLWATPNEPRGAVFQFTLPPCGNGSGSLEAC